MVGGREKAVRIFFDHLAAVLSKPADRAHVLTRDRDPVAGLEAVTDSHPLAWLGPRRRRPG